MARKVGFDTPDTEQKKSIADSYLDEFREKRVATLVASQTRLPPKKREWGTIVFLTIWIAGWSCAILFCLGLLFMAALDAFVMIFLLVWVTVACVFWVLAFKSLIAAWRGIPMEKTGHSS